MLQTKHAGIAKWLLIVGMALAFLILIFAGEDSEQAAPNAVQAPAFQKTSEERRLKYLLQELDGVSDVSVMLECREEEIVGVAVICENGEQAELQEKIIRLLRALYGLGAHQIGVSG